MTPTEATAWIRVARDIVLLVAGTYLLLQEQAAPGPADVTVVGAAMTLLLGPAFLRGADWLGKRGNGNGNGHA